MPEELNVDEERPKVKGLVYVLYTGGTLGMVPDPRYPDSPASPLVPGKQHELERYLPAITKETGIAFYVDGLRDLDGRPVEPIDSSDVNSNHWRYMANAIKQVYTEGPRHLRPIWDQQRAEQQRAGGGKPIAEEFPLDPLSEFDGFVILHGTDTMAYTASALSFMLRNLAKPVVITGSQLPMSDPRTDAISNFVNALFVAAPEASALPLIPEVILVFAGAILRGNRVRKMSSSAWQGFDTPNYPHLGSIGEHIRIASEYVRAPADNKIEPLIARLDLEKQIADISLFPGIQQEQLSAVLLNHSLQGAVLRTFGSGNAPSDPQILDVIDQSVKSGKVIVNVTQCPEGMVEAGLYDASSGLLERGVVSGLDLTPEAALTKLMLYLANEPRPEVGALMQVDDVGEQSASLFDAEFGPTRQDSDLTEDAPGVTRTSQSVTVASRYVGRFDRTGLQQATIRVRNLRVSGPPQGEKLAIDVFLNHPQANRRSTEDSRHATQLNCVVGESMNALADVTAVARSVLEGGRAIQLTFVPRHIDRAIEYEADVAVDFDAAFLALFTR